ncbi:MAG: class I SAM-dependent DNA methyltransferase [Parvibaculaceae bacterium]
MTPEQFIKKWKASTLTERAASQSHFIDLCALLDEPTPTDVDPTGAQYAFERGATKTTGGEGWADVWKRGCFAWEYKGKRKDLKAAYAQLQQYAVALENPPLLIVSDMETFEIHTNWTNTVHEVHRIGIEELREAHYRNLLKAVFSDPDRLKPGQTRQALTEQAAREFAGLALRLRGRGHDPQRVAHFVNRLVFCMFAEDVGLLPGRMFQRMLEQGTKRPDQFAPMAQQLFAAMRTGGLVGFEEVAWFNGGLFDDDEALPLEKEDIAQALAAARLDWAEIDPSIFGTLFERGLDPDKRSQLGAHYTDRDKIMLIVGPVIVEPLTREWEEAKKAIQGLLKRAGKAKSPSAATKARNDAQGLYTAFLERLKRFRVLDPACGSGNFLYLGLLALKELEHRVNLDAEVLGFHRAFPAVGPEAVRGIEINPYAAELARVSVWIGEIQWMRRNGFSVPGNPILKPLDNIECRDAVLNENGSEAEWPKADAIIGNPPFLGKTKQLSTLGSPYVERLRAAYQGRIPAGADIVTYWFEKARQATLDGQSSGVGLVATQSIRAGASGRVLQRISEGLSIFCAWADEPWVLDGAAVRVSLVCFARPDQALQPMLNGIPVERISAVLRGNSTTEDTNEARVLAANAPFSFHGVEKAGAFDIPGELAREWLTLPLNPNGRPNSDVLRPLCNGRALTGRPDDAWIIDFSDLASEADAAFYEKPFAHVVLNVKPARLKNNREGKRRNWWRHGEVQPAMRRAIKPLKRYIVTSRVAKHRTFVWLQKAVIPDTRLHVISLEDDLFFGVLHSRFHELWSLSKASRHGKGNDPTYNGWCFETFPFPDGLELGTPSSDYAHNSLGQRIAEAALKLHELRDNWLNPANLVRREPEVVQGFPDRLLPVDEKAAAILKQRTLTTLYNERPAWLANAHHELDEAVAAAYGWPSGLSDDEVLSRLLALNAERADGSANDAGSQ